MYFWSYKRHFFEEKTKNYVISMRSRVGEGCVVTRCAYISEFKTFHAFRRVERALCFRCQGLLDGLEPRLMRHLVICRNEGCLFVLFFWFSNKREKKGKVSSISLANLCVRVRGVCVSVCGQTYQIVALQLDLRRRQRQAFHLALQNDPLLRSQAVQLHTPENPEQPKATRQKLDNGARESQFI
jgi:hypothetical protein